MSLKNNQGLYQEDGFKSMKKENPLHVSYKIRRIKEKEVHQESLHLEIQKRGMIEHLTLNDTIVTRRVIMLKIAPRRSMVHTTTLEATTGLMIKEEEMNEGMITMEELKEEEEMLQVTMKKVFALKIDTPSMKVMLAKNMNIFLFLLLLVPLLRIRGIVGWLIVGPLITSLLISKFYLIWWRGSHILKSFLEMTTLIPLKVLGLSNFI